MNYSRYAKSVLGTKKALNPNVKRYAKSVLGTKKALNPNVKIQSSNQIQNLNVKNSA
jgi:hypothetical protein